MKEKIFELITALLEEAGAEEGDYELTEDSSFLSDLEFSSLEVMELLSSLEDEFGVKVKDRDIQYIETVKDLIDYVENA